MLTLDEAVAKYREARDRMPDATYVGGRWLIDAKEALDAAVRNVALAELQELEPWVGQRKWLEMRARIHAAFGIEDHPHG